MTTSRPKTSNGIICLLMFYTIFLYTHNATAATDITDNFDSDLSNWTKPHNNYFKITDGTLANKTVYVDHFGLKKKDIGNFKLSFLLKLIKNSEDKPGHFAITIDRGYGIWKLYFTSNKNTSQFTSKFYPADSEKNAKALFNEVHKLPLPLGKWLEIEISCNKQRYELRIAKQTFLLGTAPGYGGISFGSYKQPVAFDNFKITYSKPEPLSPNLLINSSFEYATNPDVPDYWAGTGERYRTQGLPPSLYTAEAIKEFHDNFYLDKNNALHGNNSIRIESPFHLQSKMIAVKPNNNYTISFYIKSNSDAQKVRVGLTDDSIKKSYKEKNLEIGKNWKRHKITITNHPQNKLSFFVKPLTAGKIWVDAVQVENGDKDTPFIPCWYDSGFVLPENANKNQCLSNTRAVKNNLLPKSIVANNKISISDIKLISQDPLKNSYSLRMKVENRTVNSKKMNATICMTAKSEAEQIKTLSTNVTEQSANLNFKDFTIKDLRVCINTIIADDSGKVIKQTRKFIDVPQPMRIYTEWSFYTKEKEANIVVQFAAKINLNNCTLKLEVFASGHPQYALIKKTFPVEKSTNYQTFKIPLTRFKPEKIFTIKATLISGDNKTLMQAQTRLVKHYPTQTEVKINRINRGIYVNEEPFIPYGILVSGMGMEQLKYYKECGFSYIQLISHWNKIEDNLTFLENCNKLNINASAFHVSRPYSLDPADAVKVYQSSPALIGIVPNDESADLVVYDRAIKVKAANPAIINCVNHHFISYRAFANRIDGLPGDVLSIDRYPFIMQPPGRPQMTGDIFSYELCLEMMNKDGTRERKPVFTWLQAAERFAKEPTPQQLRWQTYIALVNNCMGFTYFGGIPSSKIAWESMQSLNKEVQSLKPVLFSLEQDPQISGLDQATVKNIRILAKKLDNEITLICVNDSFKPIDATINLATTLILESQDIKVLFENRKIKTDEKGNLKDKFKPFERHVYKLKLKE